MSKTLLVYGAGGGGPRDHGDGTSEKSLDRL